MYILTIENWKLELKPNDVVTWTSPCLPWLIITDVIQEINHDINTGYVYIKWKNCNDRTYTSYNFLSKPSWSEDIKDDYL